MKNPYADAIELLFKGNIDFSKLACEVAKSHPKIFVLAVARINTAPWEEQCKALMKADKKIEAIKVCRAATGKGLYEAKVAVEGLV